MTGNEGERAKGHRVESNLGLLRQGHGLCTWAPALPTTELPEGLCCSVFKCFSFSWTCSFSELQWRENQRMVSKQPLVGLCWFLRPKIQIIHNSNHAILTTDIFKVLTAADSFHKNPENTTCWYLSETFNNNLTVETTGKVKLGWQAAWWSTSPQL